MVLQSPLLNPDRKTGEASRNTRVLVFDIPSEKVTAEYVYRFDVSKEFDPNPKNNPDEMKLSGVIAMNPTTLLILERTDLVAKLYSVDLSQRPTFLGSKWNDTKTAPALEALADPATEEVRVLPKSLVLDVSSLAGMPEKIEGIALIDQSTIAVSNDNDFDSEESKYDAAGNNIGKGKISRFSLFLLPSPCHYNSLRWRRLPNPVEPTGAANSKLEIRNSKQFQMVKIGKFQTKPVSDFVIGI
jgi:hypothetical protein